MLPTRKIYFKEEVIGYLIDGNADTFFMWGTWKCIRSSALQDFYKSIEEGQETVVHIGSPVSVLFGLVTEKPSRCIEINLTS